MKRKTASFNLFDQKEFKQQMLNWANQFSVCCFLNNNNYSGGHHFYDCLLGAGSADIFSPEKNILSSLSLFCKAHPDWLFGHFAYDLKNETAAPLFHHFDYLKFPDAFLFQPLVVVELKGQTVTISCLQDEPEIIFTAINSFSRPKKISSKKISVSPRTTKELYLETIKSLKEHIRVGDCYEINYCQEFFSEEAEINALEVYEKLTAISPVPFSAYYKLEDKYLLCASPERYLKKTGQRIISQPIKGTIKRNTVDAVADEILKKELFNDPKERSENVMVVDLVRNDLSKICKEGTVRVDELFGVYSFPQVHQLISTVAGQLVEDIELSDILSATFPMGSMTGMPKKKVMELIGQYEHSRRGIFSGTIGYINPENDFDFNVVIRSIMYNESNKYLSYQVGGAITFYSDPEKEYEECILKAKAIEEALL